MKVETVIKDKDAGNVQVTITNTPITPVDLLQNAIGGYIATVLAGNSFTPETQLNREISMAMAKTVLPSKYTTTIRE